MSGSGNVSAEALDSGRIRALMSASSRQQLAAITVLAETDSSNAALQRLPLEQQHTHAILAESQTGGRGRLQRTWYSPPGCNIYLSLGWRFGDSSLPVSVLPLVAALCTCRALARVGLQAHGIKWPNDIMVGGAKLAGILVELQATSGGPAHAVIGVGVNVNMPHGSAVGREADSTIERRWTDLVSHLQQGNNGISRNQVAATLLEELLEGILEYQTHGFRNLRSEWARLDVLAGQEIRLEHQGKTTTGIARGISEDGGLLLEVAGRGGRVEQRVIHAGEVRVHNG